MISASISLNVTTLGQFSLSRDQIPVSGGNWKQRRVRELLKILLSVEQHRIHREQVQEILWPSSSIEQAANSFGKTLYLLRRVLEPDLAPGRPSAYIALDHDTVHLIPNSMQIDADLFEAMAKQLQMDVQSRQGESHHVVPSLDDYDHPLALYNGDYLPDDLYEDWAQRRRDRLQHLYSWLLEHAAKEAIARRQGQRASNYLRTLLDHNTTDEQTHRLLMLVYARMGRRDEALNQYHLLRTTLREELHVRPLPETTTLYRSIQEGQILVDLAEVDTVVLEPLTMQTPPARTHIHAHAVTDEHVHILQSSSLSTNAQKLQEEGGQGGVLDQIAPDPIPNAGLVGRAEELHRLRQAYAMVHEGQTRVFFVHGEAGIGKTRLAREVSEWVQEQRATVLWGNCYEMNGTLPYQPIVDMLTMQLASYSREELSTLLGENASDLVKLLPFLRTKLPGLLQPESLGPEAERRNLYNAIMSYFQSVASQCPLVLVLDDLQWADTATIQLLSYLLAHTLPEYSGKQQQNGLFFLLLYRADEIHEMHPVRKLLSTLIRMSNVEEIRLKRLNEAEVQELLTQMAGHNVRPTFAAEIYKHTEGNPFFIGEAIRTLIEEGKLKKVAGRWQTTVSLDALALPQRVRLLIERRLSYLSPECRVTLAYAAVLGRQFHSVLLCRARNLSDEAIAEHVDEAMRMHLLVMLDANPLNRENEYEGNLDADLMFTHERIRDVLALWLNPLRRRLAHRQIAQAIEARYSSRLQPFFRKLAYHYQMAEESTQAVTYLQNAALQAMRVYAFADAATLLETALSLLLGEENRPQRAEILRMLSVDVYLYLARLDKAIEAGIEASILWQELDNRVKEAQSRLDVAFSFHWLGQETKAISFIQQALNCLVDMPQETRLLAKAHAQWGLSATISGNITEALEQLRIADELHEHIGGDDPFIAVVSLWARSWCAFAGGTAQEMLAYAQQSAELCRATRMFAWEPMMTYTAAWALMLQGRLEEGIQVAEETLIKAQRHNAVGAQGWAYLVLFFVAIQQGRWNEAEQFGDQTADIAKRMHETSLLARVFWGRSIRAGWLGEWERAIEYGLEGVQIALSNDEYSLPYPYLLCQTAKAYFHAGKLEQAQHYLDQSIQFARDHAYRQLPAICQRLQGRILQAQGKFEQAEGYFTQSLAELTAMHDTVEYVRTLEAQGLFLIARNRATDQEQGAILLKQAQTLFKQLGVNG